MKLEEFIPGIERLRVVFGEKSYPNERIKTFFDELRGIEPRVWNQVVERLVKEEARPPLMKEIRLAIAATREVIRESEKQKFTAEAERFFEGAPVSKRIKDQYPHLFKRVEKNLSGEE